MATNSIKYTMRFADKSTKTYDLVGVPNQEIIPDDIIAKMNAYNDAWGWAIPVEAEIATITGYEEYVGAMSSVFISANGAALVSLESAQVISEEEVTIYNG